MELAGAPGEGGAFGPLSATSNDDLIPIDNKLRKPCGSALRFCAEVKRVKAAGAAQGLSPMRRNDEVVRAVSFALCSR